MNISYIGATENSNYKRFAVIQYKQEEEEKADRFVILLNSIYKINEWFGEEDLLYIEVEDKEEYDYVKKCFSTYKKTKIFNKLSKYFSYEAMYENAESDAEMYCFLVNEGRTEKEIKDIMLEVSGATDAYNNALETIASELF